MHSSHTNTQARTHTQTHTEKHTPATAEVAAAGMEVALPAAWVEHGQEGWNGMREAAGVQGGGTEGLLAVQDGVG